MISVSSLILTPIALRNAWVRASVLDISIEKISEPAILAQSGRPLAEGFGHAHRDGGLAGAGLSREEDRAAGDLTVADHLQDLSS